MIKLLIVASCLVVFVHAQPPGLPHAQPPYAECNYIRAGISQLDVDTLALLHAGCVPVTAVAIEVVKIRGYMALKPSASSKEAPAGINPACSHYEYVECFDDRHNGHAQLIRR